MKINVIYEYDTSKSLLNNINSLKKYKKYPHDYFYIRFTTLNIDILSFINHLRRYKKYHKLIFVDYHIDDEYEARRLTKKWDKEDIIFEYVSFDRFSDLTDIKQFNVLKKHWIKYPDSFYPEYDSKTGKPIIPAKYNDEDWD